MKPLVMPAIVVANVIAVCLLLWWFIGGRLDTSLYRLDVDVYRLGSSAWQGGEDLYGRLLGTANGDNLPYSYPPIADRRSPRRCCRR